MKEISDDYIINRNRMKSKHKKKGKVHLCGVLGSRRGLQNELVFNE